MDFIIALALYAFVAGITFAVNNYRNNYSKDEDAISTALLAAAFWPLFLPFQLGNIIVDLFLKTKKND